MSIAWATVVIVVLLPSGFAFFWGLYAPNQVTREVSPTSPLAQLPGIVVIRFFAHAFAYLIINTKLCTGQNFFLEPPRVDFDELSALLRIDAFTQPGAERRVDSLLLPDDGLADEY